jgi:UDP-N-acetylmuramate--alanine ligase
MNIFFSGIGGVGIGPLAEITIDAGHTAFGSDAQRSEMTDILYKRGVEIYIGNQDGVYLENINSKNKIDMYIYTAALPDDHPELAKARNLGIKTAKRDELLARIIKEKNLELIAIAGTHGKTTTTGMVIWAMQQLGEPVSYSIGTTLSFGPSGVFNPASKYFVYECDEFDKNFLHFDPEISLITSIDYDHPDTYPTEKDYMDAFEQFGEKSNKIVCWSDQNSELFALDKTVVLDKKDVLKIKLPGEHNRQNATLAIEALKLLDLNGDLVAAIETFPGTNRRFEKLAENLYSDYGHHPIEIEATLQMAREISDNVVLVYQPHQNIRQHQIIDDYKDQFLKAEVIYWLPTYLSRENNNLEILKPEDLIKNITNKDSIVVSDFDDKLWENIERERAAGKLVICMGAGSIDGWVRGKIN